MVWKQMQWKLKTTQQQKTNHPGFICIFNKITQVYLKTLFMYPVSQKCKFIWLKETSATI